MKIPTLTDIKNWAHSLATFLGMAGAGLAVVVNFAHTFNNAIPTMYVDEIGAIGLAFVAISKAIDSWNNATVVKTALMAGVPVAHPALKVIQGGATPAPPVPPAQVAA